MMVIALFALRLIWLAAQTNTKTNKICLHRFAGYRSEYRILLFLCGGKFLLKVVKFKIEIWIIVFYCVCIEKDKDRQQRIGYVYYDLSREAEGKDRRLTKIEVSVWCCVCTLRRKRSREKSNLRRIQIGALQWRAQRDFHWLTRNDLKKLLHRPSEGKRHLPVSS